MTGNGFAGPMGRYLSVSFDNKDWHIMIRRTDGRASDLFMGYHGRTIGPADVATFVPNWDSLEWSPITGEVLGSRGVAAPDRDISVRLLTTKDSLLSGKQIVTEFREFMASKDD